MSNKNYFINISAVAGFVMKYFRFFMALTIIVFMLYLEIVIINVFSAVRYIPDASEVKTKLLSIKTKNETINSIETYFLNKENNLVKNLQREVKNNPFSLYTADDANSTDNADSSVAF